MQVDFFLPSENDALSKVDPRTVTITPRFWSRGHKPPIGTFVVRSASGGIVDRVALLVNGKGRIVVVRQTEEVAPPLDDAQ